MASVLQVKGRTNPWLAIRAASMYFYIDAMWARAEDPRNRTLADLQMVEYPASGDPSEHIDYTCHPYAVTLYDPGLVNFVCCKTVASIHMAMRNWLCPYKSNFC
jgi:hypothetical protein